MKSYLKAMRLGRWPRSLAIFMGTAAFFLLHQDFLSSIPVYSILSKLFLSFFFTWAISTANYIMNEIVDAPYDIHHPTKKNRPLVKGEIKKTPFFLMGIFLILVSLILSYLTFSLPFFLSLFVLLLAGFIYNVKPFRAKDLPFLDSISESANNPIRFFIGWFTFAPSLLLPPLSLLLSWWAFGNVLMIAKRLSEFRFLQEKAGIYRASLLKYSQKSMLWGMGVSALIFLAGFIYFAWDYSFYYFVYISPLVAVYLFLIFFKTLKEKQVMEEPESLLSQPLFAIYTSFLVILFLISFWII